MSRLRLARRRTVMSVCETCPQPGHCCRSIMLGGGSFAIDAATTDEAEAEMARQNLANASGHGKPEFGGPMPFRPLFKRASDGVWIWWCPNLSPATGRCLDYANRPYACRDYEPKSDAICILFGTEQ